MKLFFDEDTGTGIPKALKLLHLPGLEKMEYPRVHVAAPVRKGAKDTEWIPWVAHNGYVAVSRNHRMLENPVELNLLVEQGMGIVFARDGQAQSYELFRALLIHWDWLLSTARSEPRPFCYLLGKSGEPLRHGLPGASAGPGRA